MSLFACISTIGKIRSRKARCSRFGDVKVPIFIYFQLTFAKNQFFKLRWCSKYIYWECFIYSIWMCSAQGAAVSMTDCFNLNLICNIHYTFE